ncbi:MAG: hypothetical protein SV862_14105, partial [Pseudomonadota bacterium]|nr:hypothetical protein [Pseudomonadota bacterium]
MDHTLPNLQPRRHASVLFAAPLLAALVAAPASATESSFPPAPLPPASVWQPVEEVRAYAVSGSTGIDLYRSIGGRAAFADRA